MPRMNIADLPDEVTDHKWVLDIPVGTGKKQTVYRYEFFANGTAHIFKSPEAEEHSYEVLNGLCSCPAGIHGRDCKHLAPIIGFHPA